MRGYMFRNRVGALFFVAASVSSAAMLVGGEGDQGVLLSAAEELAQQKSAMAAAADGLSAEPVVIPTTAASVFTADEDLIDEATGFDPTPVEDGAPPASEVVPHDEVVIVSRDDGAAGQ
jgi:hypothetical protein